MKKKGRRFFRRPFFCPRIRKKACGAGITRMMPAEKTPPAQGRGLCSVSFRSLCPLGTEKRLQRDGGEVFSGAERCAETGRRPAGSRSAGAWLPKEGSSACGAGIIRMRLPRKHPRRRAGASAAYLFGAYCSLGTEKRLQRDGGEGFSGAERCAEAGRRPAILRPVLSKACREPLCRGMVAERGKFRLRVRHHKDEAAPETPPAQGRGLCSVSFRCLCPLGTEKLPPPFRETGAFVFSTARGRSYFT